MDSTTATLIGAIVVMVIFSAYFSATETAFSSLNKIRLRSKAEAGNSRAALTLSIANEYDRMLSTILIGNNIVNITASTLGTVLFTRLFDAYGPTISTVVLTVVVLIFGEISPKSIAKESPERFAMWASPLLRVLLVILRPLNFLFSQWKRLLSHIIRPADGEGITEDELITMVSEAENEGGLDQHESQLIRSAIEFGDLEAGDILTPRVDIVAVEDSATMDDIAAVFAESGYSRLPVYHKDVDDIVGLIHEKDFHAARYRGRTDISGCITPVHYTTANAELGALLRTLQKKKIHMAVVVDEYGGTSGLVTLEDLLEELVGNIYDEFDPQAEQEIIQLEENLWRVSGSADLEELAEAMDFQLPEDEDRDYDTLGGLVFAQLAVIPEDGSRPVVEALGLRIRVEELCDRRVEWALVEKQAPAAAACE